MKLTIENVTKLVPGMTVTEEKDGIRIYHEEYGWDGRLPIIGNIMQCALSLGLDPSQIKDESSYEQGTDWGGMTGKESDVMRFDITFLYDPVQDRHEHD